MKLLTGLPGWSTSADVIVIGSGVAGLTTALNLRSYGLSVLLVTKAQIDEGSTKWAQGGIAAALGPLKVSNILNLPNPSFGLKSNSTKYPA